MPGTMVGYNQTLGEVGGCQSCGMKGGAKSKGAKKRKLTPYNKFVKVEMPKLIKENPSKKVSELMKLVAKKWKESTK